MSHYDEQRDMYEQKLREAKPVQTTFEQNVAKLVNLSDANIKQHYEYQVEIYTKYVDHLKKSSENSDLVTYLTKELKAAWSEEDLLRILSFQKHCKEITNKYFAKTRGNDGR